MHFVKPLVLTAVALSSFATAAQTQPDLILLHGAILTGEGLDHGSPRIVSALAIAAGKVLAAGSDEEVERLATPSTKVWKLDGHTFVMPGLNDAHVHLGGAGQVKLNVDLTGSVSLDEMVRRVKAKADASPAGHWLTGGGWDHTLWANKTLPSRRDLDRVTGDHPALLERIDGHIAVANCCAESGGDYGQTSRRRVGALISMLRASLRAFCAIRRWSSLRR